MGMNLTRQTFSTAPDYFIAGTNIGVTTTVKEAGETLAAHTHLFCWRTERQLL